MTVPGPRPLRRARLSYRRQQMLSLLLLATFPLALFSILAMQRVGEMATADASSRANDAASAVRAILIRSGSDLELLVTSYATWDRLRSDAAALNTADIAGTVIDFQVAQGTVDAAILSVGKTTVAGGDPAVVALLESALAPASVAPLVNVTGAFVGPSYVAFRDGVYEVAARRIDMAGLSGPGAIAASSSPVMLAFASRLDAAFVVHAHQLTGFRRGHLRSVR